MEQIQHRRTSNLLVRQGLMDCTSGDVVMQSPCGSCGQCSAGRRAVQLDSLPGAQAVPVTFAVPAGRLFGWTALCYGFPCAVLLLSAVWLAPVVSLAVTVAAMCIAAGFGRVLARNVLRRGESMAWFDSYPDHGPAADARQTDPGLF